MKDEVKDDDATQTEQKQRRSLDDAGAYTFHPTPSNIYRPTRNRPHCRVLLLDGQHHTFPVDKKAKAFVAINELFHHLDLKDLQEKEFFSIYYIDTSGCRIFLNPFKQIRKQLPNASSRTTWDLYFGVQFYATELRLLSDEITVYQYVLQICRDIKEKRINADRLKKLELVSLLVQANCGDYDAEEHKPGYVDPYIDMIYNPSEIPIGLPNSVSEEHKKKTGLTPNQADDDFFTEAKGIYRFGQQVFPVQDRRGQSGEIGASLKGLYFHKDGKLFMNIPWEDVITVGYRNKKIRIRYHPKGGSDHEEEMLYLYSSKPNAKLVWRGCVEQHTFFRLSIPTPLVSNTTRSYHSFNRNSELRFSRGRTLYQMLRGERKQLPPIRRSLSLIIHTDNKKRPSKEGSPDIREAATPKSKSPTPSPIDNPESFNNVMPRSSTASETLQDKIEKALSEKRLDRSDFGSDQANSDINITVEINYSGGEESKSDAEEQIQSDSIKAESDDDSTFDKGDASCDLMKVEITKSNPDLTNIVEFSSSVKNDTSFMVMLEETSPSPPPDLKDIAMVEGKYRSDSIITNDLGPAAQYLLERSNLKDGTVSATAVDIEVRTPTPSHDETGAEFMEQELNEVSYFNSENDIEVSIDTTTENF